MDGRTIRNAVGHALDAVLLVRAVDAATMVVEAANEAARALLGVETGQNLAEAGTSRLAALTPRLLLAAQRARATREPFVVRSETGAEVRVEVQLETMKGTDGSTRVMAVFRTGEIDLGREETGDDPTVGVFRVERGIGFVFVDDALCNLLGLSHEQALGQGWLDAVVPDDRSRVDHALARADGPTEAIDLECRVLRHGVDERNVRIRAVPVRGDDGALTGYLGSIEDDTEQRRSLRANTRLAELVDAVQEIVGVSDASWRMVYANPSCRQHLCIPDDEPLGSFSAVDFIPEELREEMTQQIGRHLDRDGRWSGSLVLRAQDGHLLDVECTLLRHGEVTDPDHYVSFLGRDVTALHQAEGARRESEERFRLMAEASAVGIFMIGRGGVVEYANPRIGEMLARPLPEVLGSIVTNSVHPDDKKRVYAESNAAARERRESTLEFDAVRPSGEIRRLRANSVPVFDEAGAVRGFVGSVLDITDERRAESRLSAGAAWFRSLVQHAPDLLAVLDADGVVRYVSPSAARLTGYEPEELIGRRLSELTEFDISGVAQQISENPGTPVGVVAPMRHRDGTERMFEADITNLLDDQYVHGFVVNARDVTDRTEAEAGRRRSETALRAIVQASPLAIFALDRAGTVHLWNAASERMFG
ncbi:MAG TPA: PAS domain S-box protein, partial [Acidimicrobiia bacterium]|nr:PAS domain S-box protein [Acidimicrobiia bacterium]